jgi:hypothetical protein
METITIPTVRFPLGRYLREKRARKAAGLVVVWIGSGYCERAQLRGPPNRCLRFAVCVSAAQPRFATGLLASR